MTPQSSWARSAIAIAAIGAARASPSRPARACSHTLVPESADQLTLGQPGVKRRYLVAMSGDSGRIAHAPPAPAHGCLVRSGEQRHRGLGLRCAVLHECAPGGLSDGTPRCSSARPRDCRTRRHTGCIAAAKLPQQGITRPLPTPCIRADRAGQRGGEIPSRRSPDEPSASTIYLPCVRTPFF